MDARDTIGPWLEAKGRQVTAYVKLPIELTATQRLEREKDVVPESDLSHSCENSETDRKDERQPQPSSESTISERDEVVTVILSEEGEEQESKNVGTGARVGNVESEEKKREDNDEEDEVAASNRGLSRGTMKVLGRGGNRAALMETKKMKVRKSSKKQEKNRTEETNSSRADSDGGESRVRRSTRAKRQSVWLQDTFSRSPSREEDDLTTRKKRRVISAKTDHGDVSDVAPTQTTQTASNSSSEEPRHSSASAPTQTTGSMSSASSMRPSKDPKRSSSSTPNGKISMVTTAVSQGSSRLAMAEFMSQRQQLMSRVADPDSQDARQKRQRSLSESDYGLSDLDLPSVDPKPSVSRKTSASETPRGLRKSNLERKRVFFRAKQLAFEQLKWHRENEFQQRELKLLRREMETREALAKQELAIKRMRIRADIIQPMISAGASVAEIAERLKML